MKKLTIIIPLIIFITVIFFLSEKKETTILAKEDLITIQKKVDDQINKGKENKNYKINSPYILNNPYKISPLTSLIIFSSEESITVEVFINDKLYKTIDSKTFSIPIVGLRENYNNKIELKANDKTYEYYINTPKVINTTIKTKGKSNNNYLVSGTKSKHFILNETGEVIWYLDLDTQGLLEKTSSDTFFIGTEESILDENISTFTGLYEIDYLGKIRRRIDNNLGYHHCLKFIGDNRLLVLGSNLYPMDTVYELDINSGLVKKKINLLDVLSQENSQLKNYLVNLEYGMGTNSLDYKDGKILVSFRNINTILEINYENATINYLITSNSTVKKYSSKYLINLNKKILGIHDVRYLGNKNISFYNNGYDYTLEHKSESASGMIIKVNNKKAKQIKNKTNEKKYSYAFGSYQQMNDEELINYSYMYEKIPENKNEYESYYSHLVFYKNETAKQEIKIDDTIYKAIVFNVNMSDNYIPTTYSYYSDYITKNTNKIKTNKIFHEVTEITNNSIELYMDTLKKDIKIVFEGKENYVIPYLNTKTYFQVPSGNYSIYISVDGEYYKYKSKVTFI